MFQKRFDRHKNSEWNLIPIDHMDLSSQNQKIHTQITTSSQKRSVISKTKTKNQNLRLSSNKKTSLLHLSCGCAGDLRHST